MRLPLITTLLIAACFSLVSAEEAPEKAPAPKSTPKIEKTGKTSFRLGDITFDSAKGEVSFPAILEQREVLIEYLITNPQGKIHETLFITEVKPFKLNVVMKLLGFLESKELIYILDENYLPTDKLHPATPEQKKHSRFSIHASWSEDGKKITRNVTNLLKNVKTHQPMPSAQWVYSGSYLNNGKFKADIAGDIVGILCDPAAIGCYSGEGREDDDLWVPNRKLLPPPSTPVTLTFKKTHPSTKL